MSAINANTSIYAVFGDPIGHSLSPVMHNAAFKALQLDCVYVAFQISPATLADAVRGIRALGIKGVNITIPHKQAIIRELDQVFGDSVQSGSVNTIINRNGKLLGTSTDGTGLIRSLREGGNFDPEGKRVLLLGAGGSAQAVIYSLIKAGIASLTVVNRDFKKVIALQEKVRKDNRFSLTARELSQLGNLDFSRFDLVINTTSVGLREERSLIPPANLHPGLFVYDLVYRPGGTRLSIEAAAAGCRVLTGLSLLLFQGAESFRLWFETEPPLAAMRQALEFAQK